MRYLIGTITACVLVLSSAACSGGETTAMPDLVGKRLDVALSDVERAGFDDDVEVLGGGMFGVVDESNWTVCSQEPASGNRISSPPRLTVERSCEDGGKTDGKTEEGEDTVENDAGADKQAADAPTEPKKKKKRSAEVTDTFIMPALVGGNLQEAQDALQARGSFLLTQADGTGQERFQMLDYNWKVCAQDPPVGTVTSIAELVELVAVKLSESC